MKNRLLVATLALGFLAGCPLMMLATQEPTSVRHAGTTPVRVVNLSPKAVCTAYFAQAGDYNIDNWLEGEKPIAAAETLEFLVKPGTYTVVLRSCDGLSQLSQSLDMRVPSELIVTDVNTEPELEPVADGFSRLGPFTLAELPPQPAYTRAAPAYAAPAASNVAPAASAAAPSAPAQPQFASVTLKNNCRETVKLFKGRKPRGSSGTWTSISANTIQSMSGKAGDTIWIVDAGGNGVSAYTYSGGSQRIQITQSCSGFAPQ